MTGTALAGNVSATESENTFGTDSVGITEEVKEYLSKGETDKAGKLLDKHNITYYSDKKTLNSSEESTESPTVGTQGGYSGSDSTFSIYVFALDENLYDAHGVADLTGTENNGALQYGSKAADACGIYWENDDWEAEDPDKDEVSAYINFDGNGDGPDISVEDFDSNNGVAAEVNFNNEAQLSYDSQVNLSTDIYEVSSDGNVVPVTFEYHQYTSNSDTLSSVSVSIGPAGLSINTSTVKKLWWKDVTAGPGGSDSE